MSTVLRGKTDGAKVSKRNEDRERTVEINHSKNEVQEIDGTIINHHRLGRKFPFNGHYIVCETSVHLACSSAFNKDALEWSPEHL